MKKQYDICMNRNQDKRSLLRMGVAAALLDSLFVSSHMKLEVVLPYGIGN